MKTFEHLDRATQDVLLEVPALITLLVAGADGAVADEEMAAGINLTRWKTLNARPDLLTYYQQVQQQFSGDIEKLNATLPNHTLDRAEELINRLKMVNSILPQLEPKFAEQLYASWQELAQRIAEAEGGVLGYLALGYDESKVVKLSMINRPR